MAKRQEKVFGTRSPCIDHIVTNIFFGLVVPGQSTPLYTAPEALNDQTKFTFASDIWSLGCIFYELCMLHHPFHRVWEVNELYQLATRSIYQTIDYERKHYSREFVTLSNMMLEPNVEKRATIEKIIKQPIIVMEYYERYFDIV